MSAHRAPDASAPTQCRHPARAVTRSSAAALVGVLPIMWPLINREVGPVWATVATVAAVAGNALFTRLLAIPAVEAWLVEAIPALSADPEARRGRLDLAAPRGLVHASATGDMISVDQGGTVHAAAATRTVAGLVLPWAKLGATTAGELQIARNAVRVPREIRRVKLHFKHSNVEGSRPVGSAESFESRDDGLWMTFNVARTPDGDAAMQQVVEGVYDAFSAELHSVRRDGSTVIDSIMSGVALVDTPAFADARVTEVHAQHTNQENNTVNVKAFIRALIAAGLSEADARLRAVAEFSQAEVDGVTAADLADAAPAETPPAAPAADTQAIADAVAAAFTPGGLIVPGALDAQAGGLGGGIVHASAHDAAQTIVRLAAGQKDVAHAALSDITNSGLTDAIPPTWLGELWTGPAKARRLVPLLNHRDLRSWRIQGFKWNQKPLMASYAGDKVEIPTGPVSVSPYEAEAVRWAGGHDLDRKFFDFGDAGILESYWRAMHESYGVITDHYAGAFVVANAKVITDAGATDVLNAMIGTHAAIDDALGVSPSFYLANPADKRSLLSITNQNLPAFLSMFGVDPRSIVWTKAVPAGTMVAGAKPAVTFHELPGSPLRVEAEHLSHGGRDRAMFGYTAMTLDNADGVVKVVFDTTP